MSPFKPIGSVEEFISLSKVSEGLVPPWLAAVEAGVSRQRMNYLCDMGRFPVFVFHGMKLVSLGAVRVWVRRGEHRPGRCNGATIREQVSGCK